MRFYEFTHSIGIHVWEIPALTAAFIILVVGIVHWRNQRKREKDFEEELEELGQEFRKELAAETGGEGGL